MRHMRRTFSKCFQYALLAENVVAAKMLNLVTHAGDQVPPAGRGDREAGGPRAEQRAERGPRGAVQRGEPVHRPGPVQEAVDADHHGRAGERDRPVGCRHPQGVIVGVGRARPRLVTLTRCSPPCHHRVNPSLRTAAANILGRGR